MFPPNKTRFSGHWKANRANEFIGGVHDRRIFLRDCPKDFVQNVGKHVCFCFRGMLKEHYTHIEVVVTLVVVNFFGFLVIARYPTVRLSRNSVEKTSYRPPGPS